MTTEHATPVQPGPRASEAADPDAARRALRVQLLTTEHWSLLATRSLSWSESFARANMFLTLLTGTVVALALVAQATTFGEGFVIFALLLLPILLFVGSATVVRLGEVNAEDVVWVQGMNRLRRAYLELDPGIEPYLITGWTEDVMGVLQTYGAPPGITITWRGNLMHGLVTTPAMIAFVNCVVAGVLAGLVIAQFGASMQVSALGAAAGFVIAFLLFALYGSRKARMFRPDSRTATNGD
jgi:hypothetical protein